MLKSTARLWLGVTSFFWSMSALAAASTSQANFPASLDTYNDAGLPLLEQLTNRIEVEPFNLIATIIFALAVLHTFVASKFMKIAHDLQHSYEHKHPGVESPSLLAQLFHYLGEIEVIFGIWVVVLFTAIVSYFDWSTGVSYVDGTVNYTEALFVVIIMSLAATRPVLEAAEKILAFFAVKLGKGKVSAWWLTILIVAPLLGSFITEPAAMTIAALLLAKQFYRYKPSDKFKYGTLGLLFVNISVGGTLTNFAAPPVLMVAGPWNWSTSFMLTHFGWRAATGIVIATMAYFVMFKKEFEQMEKSRLLEQEKSKAGELESSSHAMPLWVVLVHAAFLLWTVINAHHPVMFIGGFLFFLAFKDATPQYQSRLELKSAILVGFFLAGLVNHGGLQGWWIAPVLGSLTETPLMLMATGLTAFNDNAAVTYLSTLVPNLSDGMKYAVVVGAVTGGGLTVIANAPNPAGQAILNRFFNNRVVNPVHLAIAAIPPTIILGLTFMLL